jgi:hypothetical protein
MLPKILTAMQTLAIAWPRLWFYPAVCLIETLTLDQERVTQT